MKYLVVIFVLISLSGLAIVAIAQSGPEVVVLTPRKGNINFTHHKHQEIIPDCGFCHHQGVDKGPCRGCHNGEIAPRFMRKAHFFCRDCHKEKGMGTKCTQCHQIK
ncbi:MAG: cytochrome c3 family protein [Nitrospirota bacterium]|nr:MAG: cytochrome c3 family protein [Nitrospirota bacterium]